SAQVSGNFYFEKSGATINIRFESASVVFGSVASITAVNGTFTATANGVFGAVAGTVALSPNLGFSFSTNLRLAVNTTTSAQDIDLDGDAGNGAETHVQAGPYLAIAASNLSLTIGSAQVNGNFYFEKSGATINIRFQSASVTFGSVVSITGVNGAFTATATGVYGAVQGTITLSPTLGFTFDTDLRLAINTTTSAQDIDLDGDAGNGAETHVQAGPYLSIAASNLHLTIGSAQVSG